MIFLAFFIHTYTKKVQEIFQILRKKFGFFVLPAIPDGKWKGLEDMEDTEDTEDIAQRSEKPGDFSLNSPGRK